MCLKDIFNAYAVRSPDKRTIIHKTSLALRRGGITTMEQLQELSPETLSQMRDIGPKRMMLIRDILQDYHGDSGNL